MSNIEKINKGTRTVSEFHNSCLFNINNNNNNSNKQLSPPEEHNSTSFLKEILNDIEISKKESSNHNESIRFQPSSISEDDSLNSSIRLYEMKSKSNKDDKHSPLKIKFKLHKKFKSKRHCRFADQTCEISSCAMRENYDKKFKNIHYTAEKTSFKEDVNKKPQNNQQQKQPEIQQDQQPTSSLQLSPRKPLSNEKSCTFLESLKKTFNKINQQKTQRNLKYFTNKNDQQGIINDSPKSGGSVTEEKMEIYYFDHGSAEYFRTTDCPPNVMSEVIAQQTTYYATRFWAEIFGSLHIGVTFFVTFFLQFYRFLLYSILRAILFGTLQITSDYLLKPLITVIFNGYLQPPLVLIYNLLSSIKDMLEPIAETFDMFLKPITNLIKSFRLLTIKFTTNDKNDKNDNNVKEV